MGIILSSPPRPEKEDIALHSRPLLIVPEDNTFVVAATVAADDEGAGVDAVAVVACALFLAVCSFSLSASISGCLLGLTSGMAL